MRRHRNAERRAPLLAACVLAIVALACGAGQPGANATVTPAAPVVDVQGTTAALQATVDASAAVMTAQAQVPPTQPQLPTAEAPEEPTEPPASTGLSFSEEFASDTGSFETFDGAEITGGEFYMGQFTDCGDLAADSQFGCFSTCLSCGLVADYGMVVDVRYVDGISERTYGLVMQFVDENGNSVVDREDFYTEFQISAFTSYYIQNVQVRTHFPGNPVGIDSWDQIWYDARDYTNAGYGANTLGVKSFDGGTSFELYVNDNYIDTVSKPTDEFSQGSVGISLSGRRVQVAFDNFAIDTE